MKFGVTAEKTKTASSKELADGRSRQIRTAGLLDPNQARYQLRYTPISPFIINISTRFVKT